MEIEKRRRGAAAIRDQPRRSAMRGIKPLALPQVDPDKAK
jgi:hypothetical protein